MKIQKNFLINKTTKTPVFSALPKLQKKIDPPPGRPIISGIGSSTKKAGIFVDDALKPHVLAMPSYLRDLLQLFQILHDMMVPTDAWLITLNIEALYLSIPHEVGLSTISRYIHEQDRSSWSLNDFILDLLRHILFNNIFLFEGTFYRQKQGVAMGAHSAPWYANLTLRGWERNLFAGEGLEMYLCHTLCWHRYIEYVLIVWTGDIQLFQEFVTKLECNNLNLKFTYCYDQRKVHFWTFWWKKIIREVCRWHFSIRKRREIQS